MIKVLVMTEERAFEVTAKEQRRVDRARSEDKDYFKGSVDGMVAIRAAMTEVDVDNSVNLFCDGLAARVSPATKQLLQQFLEALLARIKEATKGVNDEQA